MAGKVGRAGKVEVRKLAGGRALRIDDTFASWYRPGQVLTNSVWDALVAPIAWLSPSRRRSVLILGLGGGSAARIVRALAPEARIVGVELDPRVVRAARADFDLDDLDVEVVIGDALSFLERGRERFDAVLEDVFVGSGRALRKPDGLPEPGLRRAARRLARDGVLVSNALDEAPAVGRAMEQLFPSTARIAVAGYDNRMVVGGPASLSPRALRSAVAGNPVLAPSLRRLTFRRLRGDRRRETAAPLD